ncbi:hypothetical protein MexAM1_META1p4446 [Methylorubrum extorquens AM1]|uniref:Uncharacterized protein n=1 Tax=Methylorubrum extorquens (strain ATCC 14718 / DSM 1338 / JCM 2805 / NCIMB 9133 / AM1) TaxID=272630 RepID=C5AQ17_METEA|nr:hypothetical protein MexAM1_META1p4446 [Methylorubrum extorquens AM1]
MVDLGLTEAERPRRIAADAA